MNNIRNDREWVNWFRHASPYIKAHQNKIMVVALGGSALAHPNFYNLIHDFALLNSLGTKLVIVFGARPQIDAQLNERALESRFHKGMRVTDAEQMEQVLAVYGRLRVELEANLSMGVVNSPMDGANIKVVSGNFVMAQPVGVLEGVDLQSTGRFRKLDVSTVSDYLDSKSIVLIPALGYSTTGEVFNLVYEDLAANVASSLEAEKLLFLSPENGCRDIDGHEQNKLSLEQVQRIVRREDAGLSEHLRSLLKHSLYACEKGVKRVHLVSFKQDEAFLKELFTRDGSGTMISQDDYDEIRPAELADVNGILELIRPLEEMGVLVKRSRERVESELDCFWVNTRDKAVVACAALYAFPEQAAGELSCFAVDEDYRKEGRGDRLLEKIVEAARARGFDRLFVLTTQTEHWFKERGFVPSACEELPQSKRYNPDRNAKVLVKTL